MGFGRWLAKDGLKWWACMTSFRYRVCSNSASPSPQTLNTSHLSPLLDLINSKMCCLGQLSCTWKMIAWIFASLGSDDWMGRATSSDQFALPLGDFICWQIYTSNTGPWRNEFNATRHFWAWCTIESIGMSTSQHIHVLLYSYCVGEMSFKISLVSWASSWAYWISLYRPNIEGDCYQKLDELVEPKGLIVCFEIFVIQIFFR